MVNAEVAKFPPFGRSLRCSAIAEEESENVVETFTIYDKAIWSRQDINETEKSVERFATK